MSKEKGFWLAAALLLGNIAIQARNEWHEPPVVLLYDCTTIDSVPANTKSAMAHVRLGAANNKACAWELQWSRIDSDNYIAARVDVPSAKDLENLYTTVPTVTVTQYVDGGAQPVLSRSLTRESAMISLRLIYDGVSARLYAGDAESELIGTVPYDAARGGAVAVDMEEPMRVQRVSASHEDGSVAQYCRFADLEELDRYLAGSEDVVEGYWQHLDRDINQQRGSFGGKYTLTIAKNDEGGYDIIYLSGADINSEHWQPLMIKGRMTPTQFIYHYDLVWYDAYGVLLDDDNHAQLIDNAILALNFPVYNSQIRIRRGDYFLRQEAK